MEIVELDARDETALRAWYDVQDTVLRHDRPNGWRSTYASVRSSLAADTSYYRHLPLAAVEGDSFLGVADLGLSLADNTHFADLEILVLPEDRNRGVGTGLLDHASALCRDTGRTTVGGELYLTTGDPESESAGLRFAEKAGFEKVHTEDHLVLPLPVAPARVDRLRARTGGASDYEVVTWVGGCPDDLVAAYTSLLTQMLNDVPMGEVDYQPVPMTEERLRVGEAKLALSWDVIVAAVRRRSDGVFGGYSRLFVPRDSGQVMQDDTLVMPDHRGQRLGTLLKLSTLELLMRDHPERRSLHTWTDPDNHAMYRTNSDFGFVAAERMYEMQRKDG